MAKKATFLKTTYCGYYHNEEPQEDVDLTHVSPGTPGGEWHRRFWHPVAFSHDLKDLPVRIRILGEDLVLFRDLSGSIGLMELHCPHRGSSLEFGRISEHGIRCCYHGWLMDVDGKVLETPGEPPESTFKDRLCHGAYPTVEYKGLIFGYMGPPEKRPPFPIYDTFNLPGYELYTGRKHFLPCNWLQAKENSMDPAHLVFLHTIVNGTQFNENFGLLPELDFLETQQGTIYMATRRIGENVWVRINDFIAPTIHQFAPVKEDGTQEKIFGRPFMTVWSTPIDDTHCMNISFMHLPEDENPSPEKLHALRESFGQTGDRSYEERQRIPGDYDAQVSQRPIAVHALEHLGATDRGIIMLRNFVRQGIQTVQRGEDPAGLATAEGQVIPTLCQDTVLRIPPAATEAEDRRMIREIARKVAAGHYVRQPVGVNGAGH